MPPVSRKQLNTHEGQFELDLMLPEQGESQADLINDVDPQSMTIDELVQLVARTRQRNTEAQAELTQSDNPEVKQHPLKGGAFGGALKRRIELSDSKALYGATNEHDIALLKPTTLRAELFPATRGDLVYDGVLFAPDEYVDITVSAAEVARRVGANVMANTTERPPTERLERRAEVVSEALQRRLLKAELLIGNLESERMSIARLRKEMRSPGYSHMSQEDADRLMTITESVMAKMFDAIIVNHRLPTKRTQELTNAMHYLISSDDYKATFSYWKQVSSLAEIWTINKNNRLTKVHASIGDELARIS